VTSTKDASKKCDITETLNNLIKHENSYETLSIDSGKLNKYVGYDIHFGFRKELKYTIVFSDNLHDVISNTTHSGVSDTVILENSNIYTFSQKNLNIKSAVIKLENNQQTVIDVIDKLILHKSEDENTLTIDSSKFNELIENDTSSKKHMELVFSYSKNNKEESDSESDSESSSSSTSFSIDNVNTIANLFSESLNRLNWTINLINEKKSTIIEQNSYSKVIRPIIELKYGSQKEEDDFNIYVFQFAKQNMLYFYQSSPSFDDMYIYNLNEPHKTLFKDLNEKFYDPTAKLISDNQDVLTNTNRLYNCLFGLTVNGIDLQIQYIMKDILDDTKYVIISETLGITKKMAQINSYDTIPPTFNTFLPVEDSSRA
jgi:hypothetical protein